MNYSLLLTLIVGLFIMVGALIVFKTKNNEKIINFSISMALGVMAALALFELLPESLECFKTDFGLIKSIILVISAALIGIGILRVLDHFIPDHVEENKTKKAKIEHLYHIGIVSAVALVIHNIIEGMALYSASSVDLKMGLLMCLGIGLHNIPVGMILTSTFYNHNKNKKNTILLLLGVSLSTFIGGFIIFLVRDAFITSNVLGILLGITLGMIIYIVVWELIPQVKRIKNKKSTITGIVTGVFLLVISLLF